MARVWGSTLGLRTEKRACGATPHATIVSSSPLTWQILGHERLGLAHASSKARPAEMTGRATR